MIAVRTLRLAPAAATVPVALAYAAAALSAPAWTAMPADVRVATAFLGSLLVALTLIDWATMRLPDALTATLLIAGLAQCLLSDTETAGARVAGAIAGYVSLAVVATVYQRLRGHHGLGGGYGKLLAAAGAWVGLDGVAPVVLLASAGAIVAVAIARFAGRQISWRSRLPFGPFLAAATWLIWLFAGSAV